MVMVDRRVPYQTTSLFDFLASSGGDICRRGAKQDSGVRDESALDSDSNLVLIEKNEVDGTFVLPLVHDS